MLNDKNVIAEIGCGDAFGSIIVAFNKIKYYGVDVEKFIIEDNKKRINNENIISFVKIYSKNLLNIITMLYLV